MDDCKTEMGMKILAIECSVAQASLCLYSNGDFSACSCWTAERNHDQYLFPALQKALEAAKDGDLDYILVGAGPGSYGGVRVALAAAIGIATVRGAQVVALPSWEQLVQEGCCIVSDAKRGGWAVRRAPNRIEVITTEQLQQEAAGGLRIITIESHGVLQKIGIQPEVEEVVPTAEGLVKTWLAMNAEQQKQAQAMPPEPIYVRPPHITKALHKPWEIR